MHNVVSLRQLLHSWAGDDEHRLAISQTVEGIAAAVSKISRLVQGQTAGDAGSINGSLQDDGTGAFGLPLNAILDDSLVGWRAVPPAVAQPGDLAQVRSGDGLAVTMDPLNGTDLDANAPTGTIFSVWPAADDLAASPWLGRGSEQLAAGFAIYGPRTDLVLTVRQGVQVFTLDFRTSQFNLARPAVRVPRSACEYAVNAAHHRHWDKATLGYLDDCLSGARHPSVAFDMRWTGSLVAEAFRVLVRGGICLYPRDARPGYEQALLRLVHEANPIALLMEQAGGAATDGIARTLDEQASSLRERVPLVFGSAGEVDRVKRHHTELCLDYDRSPLFANRGLFQRQERL